MAMSARPITPSVTTRKKVVRQRCRLADRGAERHADEYWREGSGWHNIIEMVVVAWPSSLARGLRSADTTDPINRQMPREG